MLGAIVSIVGAGTGLQELLMSAGMDSLGAVELHRELCRHVLYARRFHALHAEPPARLA